MKRRRLTGWISGSLEPVRVGVYQRDYGHSIFYAYWTGKLWRIASATPEEAAAQRHASGHQPGRRRGSSYAIPWRGLTENQE